MKAWRLGFKEVAGAGLAVASANDLKETAKVILSRVDPTLCADLCEKVNGWGTAGATLFVLATFLVHRAASHGGEKAADDALTSLLEHVKTLEGNHEQLFQDIDKRRELGRYLSERIKTDIPDEMKEDTDFLIQKLFSEETAQRFDDLEDRLISALGTPARRTALVSAYLNPSIGEVLPHVTDAVRADLIAETERESESLFGKLQSLVDHFLLPKVYLPLPSEEETLSAASRLRFSERLVPHLIGRDQELKDLQSFLEHKDPLKWWLITAEGGQGKSRLALELLYRNYGRWRGGFVQGSYDAEDRRLLFPDLSRWEPTDDTLFVVDYVSGYASQVRRALQGLTLNGRHNRFAKRVRFLLLERYYAPYVGWATELRAVNRETLMHEEPRRLPLLEVHQLLKIFNQAMLKWSGSLPTGEQYGTAKLLFERPDRFRYRRPLYAAMLALAIHEGKDLKDLIELDDYVLAHEEELWRGEYRATQCDVNAAFFATLMGGVTQKQLGDVTGAKFGITSPRGEKIKKVLSHSENDERAKYPALEPDLLGERFVTRRINGAFYLHDDAGDGEVMDWSKELFRHAVNITDWSEPE